MAQSKYKIRVGITMGDPSGIGPVIIAKALPQLRGLAEFTVVGDGWVFSQLPGAKRQVPAMRFLAAGLRSQASGIRFIDLKNVDQKKFKFGKVKAEYGKASIEYLDKAMELIRNKAIDCLVTCPISKEAIHSAGFCYTGHTEYFAKKTDTKQPVMMLLNEKLKFSLVTRHIPLKEIPLRLEKDALCRTVSVTYMSLKKLFRIRNPRMVVCALNPHASDNGLIGDEENRIIKPALKELKGSIKNIDGPLPADVAIAKAMRKQYDCVIALYHDQAMIPLKLTGDKTGVNITLGLAFVRTSPLHGTAFDIAAASLANPNSLIAAIKLAVECVSNLKKD